MTIVLYLQYEHVTERLLLRTAYYTAYRQAYSMDFHTVYKCCPGWAHKDNEMGCLHSE